MDIERNFKPISHQMKHSTSDNENISRDETQQVVVRSKRRFIKANTNPQYALGWRNARHKATQLDMWRTSVGRGFCRSARALHVAWCLEWLFKDGFAYPTDKYLS